MLAPGKPMPGVSPAPVGGGMSLAPKVADKPDAAPGADASQAGPSAAKWSTALDLAERDHKELVDAGKKVTARYKSEEASAGKRKGKRLNILYSNTEVLRASLYGKAAKPDVRRRFSDRDPMGQAIAQVIERALIYFADVLDVDTPIDAAVLDHLLSGRGVVRVAFDASFSEDEAGAANVSDQKLRDEHVFWQDFLHGPARTWAKVPWIAFRHTPEPAAIAALVKGAPEGSTAISEAEAATVPAAWTPDLGPDKQASDADKRVELWEVWDKATRTRLWIVRGFPKVLRVDPDPYELEGFWPMPRPLAGILTSDSVIPKGEFCAYADQAEDLDEIVRRISALTKAMKRRGVYNKALAELRRLATADDNTLVPVDNFAELVKGGGLASQVEWEDISQLAALLTELYRQRDMLVQAIYEITGISDVARGSTDPDETAAAQQLKASFGSQRIKRRQRAIERWVRDLYRIKAELLLSHFDPAFLCQIANVPAAPELLQALANETLVRFAVDIETDSTVFQDAAEQQKNRTELVKGSTEFFGAWAPLIQANPAMLPLAMAYAQFATAAFPDARTISDAIDQVGAQLGQMAQQAAMAPKPPDPKTQAEQVKAQAEGMRAQTDVQVAQIKGQAEAMKAQASIQQTQADMAASQQKADLDRQKHGMELQRAVLDHQLKTQELAQQAALAAMPAMQGDPTGQDAL